MKEAARLTRNQQRLAECYPAFAARLARVIADLEAAGLRPRIQDAWRSPADQLAAFNAGTSELRYGFHNVTGAGGKKESLAAEVLDDDRPLAATKPFLLQLALAAELHGLVTGIRWGLTARARRAIDAALAEADYDAPIKIGWDPHHLQPTGITPAQAKAGKRPA